MKIAVVGGGAAGFFSALAAKQHNSQAEVYLIEKTAQLLSKVKISGGGRCNVTHACFEPKELVKNYPRGHKELLSPFYTFQPKDTIRWFEERQVSLKTEADGRMFPVTNSSTTIIECLLKEANRLEIPIWKETKLKAIEKDINGFVLDIGSSSLFVDRLILATGSSKAGWDFAEKLGHTVQSPVPSLFTFNIPSFPLIDLAGLASPRATVQLVDSGFKQTGPLLITHWGFSGPCALKLSAFGARFLAEKNYEVSLKIDWVPELTEAQVQEEIQYEKNTYPDKHLKTVKIPGLPKNLWKKLIERSGCISDAPLQTFGNKTLSQLVATLKRDSYEVRGKTTNKEEFVTCGGITLSEVQFKTMESKVCPRLFFCGEILDIDGITGGFNFQNAWTTGWIAGQAAAKEDEIAS